MDLKKQAKMTALKELKKMATDMMGGELKSKLDGMKKVTVAATDEEGLKKGLKKAEEIMGETSEEECEDEMETPEMETEEVESEEMTPEEIKAKIAELQAKLAKK